jgi:hypothetical protein
VLGWPKICKLAHVFLWECSYKRLKLAQLLGQRGVFLTSWTGTAIVVGKTAVATGAALASAGGGPLMDVNRWLYLCPGQGAP